MHRACPRERWLNHPRGPKIRLNNNTCSVGCHPRLTGPHLERTCRLPGMLSVKDQRTVRRAIVNESITEKWNQSCRGPIEGQTELGIRGYGVARPDWTSSRRTRRAVRTENMLWLEINSSGFWAETNDSESREDCWLVRRSRLLNVIVELIGTLVRVEEVEERFKGW